MNRTIWWAAALCVMTVSAVGRTQAPDLPTPPTPADLPQPPAVPPVPALPDRAGWLAQAQVDLGDGPWFEFGDASLARRVVKGAPYCADAVHETARILADGNRIVHQQQSHLCRDGEGRTREEVERNGRKRVYLIDPVAKQAWLLDPTAKRALRLGVPGSTDAVFAEEDRSRWDAFNERMKEFGERMKAFNERMKAFAEREKTREAAERPPVPPQAPEPPAPPVAPARIVIERNGAAVALPEPPDVDASVPAAIELQLHQFAPRGQGVVTPLGSKQIDGLTASGERTNWTIEAGKIGNEKPIVMTREVWTSPDLMLTVRSRDFDPRSGEINYRLTNVKRGEPDAALMRVPADYQIPAARPARGNAASAGAKGKG